MDADSYVNSGTYLPQPLRDFHDAKAVFKTMHEMVAVEQHEYAKDITWVAGQCYVIDVFLWFMAKRGWTLQRSRASVDFRDLSADIKAVDEARAESFRAMLAART